jgi:hypothetical protein
LTDFSGKRDCRLTNQPEAAGLYTPVSGTLFGPDGPSYLDVQQRRLGDCWFLASLAEVAVQPPATITDMFKSLGTTTENGSLVSVYSVRFSDNSPTPVAHHVTVDSRQGVGSQVG